MKKITFSLLFGFILAVVVTAFSILTSLPLLTLVRFGMLSLDPMQVAMGFINNVPSQNPLDWSVLGVQTILTFAAQILLFLFIRRVIASFPGLNQYFRGVYSLFFLLIFFVPVGLVYLFIFVQFPLSIFLILVGAFMALTICGITIILKKVLPQTNVEENREVLFSREKN